MLLALLWPDPCDPNCPQEFKDKAKEVLAPVQGRPGPNDEDLRKALLKFIGDFANWDRSADPVYLEASRALVKAAYGDEAPLVVDPFAGGGSIPLEALRVGCEAFASDLNPVACLILKVMLEDIPRHGPALAEELRKVGAEIKTTAEKELAEFYPPDPNGAKPIAYLWARTVRCEAPNCGAEIPLMRSFWLCKKPNRKRALKYKVIRNDGETPRVQFEIFEPKSDKEVPDGTVTRAKATCLCCNMVLQPERVRAQLVEQKGGADAVLGEDGTRTGGAILLSVVTLKPREQGRHYRVAGQKDYQAVWKAQQRIHETAGAKLSRGISLVPDEQVDEWHHDINRLPMYGMTMWGDVFTGRQKLALTTIVKCLREKEDRPLYSVPGALIGRCADYWSSLSRWVQNGEFVADTFSRQALPMVWDFAEAVPWTESSGNLEGALEWIAGVIEALPHIPVAHVELSDACRLPLPDQSCKLWFTDPPYYDAIDYAHCSDFFFVWLKRLFPNRASLQDPFNPENMLTPKDWEIVVDSTTTKGHGNRTPAFYEARMAQAFADSRRVLSEDGLGCVVFAHKSTEGWEALLSGMITGG
jgi:adenine-specific DNA methylase